MTDPTNRPLAAPGLISYRYPSRFGWVMIGARDEHDALREAARSIDDTPVMERLEVWVDGTGYARLTGGRDACVGEGRAIEGEAPASDRYQPSPGTEKAPEPHERTAP